MASDATAGYQMKQMKQMFFKKVSRVRARVRTREIFL